MARLSALVAALTLLGCGPNPPPQSATPSDDPAVAIQALVEQGLGPPVRVVGRSPTWTLAQRMAHHKVPAVSVAVFENHEIVWLGAYGVRRAGGDAIDTHTRFQAASISKPVSATAALSLVAEGTWALDTPMNDLLSEWSIPEHPWSETVPVTLSHLLSHTGGTTVHGFAGYPQGEPLPTVAQILDGTPPANSPPVRVDREPGSAYRYSGGGTTIVQLALEEHHDQPYRDLMQSVVLGPLAMRDSGFTHPLPEGLAPHAAVAHDWSGAPIDGDHHRYPELAAAGLWTTPRDLARFAIAVQGALAGRPSAIDPQVATWLTTPVLDDAPVAHGTFRAEPSGIAVFEHGGSNQGFKCNLIASMDGGFGVVVMTNGENGSPLIGEIQRALFSRDGWPGGAEVLEPADVVDASTWEGRYRTDSSGPFRIVEVDDQLWWRPPFEAEQRLFATADGRLVAADSGAVFTTTDEGVTMQARGRSAEARRLPSEGVEPMLALANGRFDEAVAAFEADPTRYAPDEGFLNTSGYTLLARGDTEHALEVLRFVTVVRPMSSNAWDSYGEALAAAGRPENAVVAYRKAIARLPHDPAVPPDERASRQAHAEAWLERLAQD